MKKISLFALAALAFSGLSRPVAAEEEASSETSFDTSTAPSASSRVWTYSVRYTDRPLTMQKHMVRATGTIIVADFFLPGTAISGLSLGGAFAVLEDLEVGISSYNTGSSWTMSSDGFFKVEGALPIIFSPSGDFGDIPLYARYRFWENENFSAAANLTEVLQQAG